MAADTTTRPLEVSASLRYGRFSPYKAREVLDLIRGKSVGEARAILYFTERACAVPILKVLESAVANAGNNNDIPPDELFITRCFADEGPTLRRFRPRARGRGTRIRKRTCHVTIVLARYSVTELERVRARESGRRAAPADARAARARRVARSRRGAAETDDASTDDEALEPTDVVDEATEAEATAEAEVIETDAADEAAELDAAADADAELDEEEPTDEADDAPADESDAEPSAAADEPDADASDGKDA